MSRDVGEEKSREELPNLIDAYPHQAEVNRFLKTQVQYLFDDPRSWLTYNKLRCPMNEVTKDLDSLKLVQPNKSTHCPEYMYYDWGIGRPGVFTVGSQNQYSRNSVTMSCKAGTMNVILLPTQPIEKAVTLTPLPTSMFRGTKLVPEPEQGDGNSHESVRIMLKTTQTSGFWLGFGRDTRRDGALWAIHVQPRENGSGLTYDQMRDRTKGFTILANDKPLEILNWLDPRMYYYEPRPAEKKWFGKTAEPKRYLSQITGFPLKTTAGIPDWTFFIQLCESGKTAETYTVLSFETTQVGGAADLLKRDGQDPPPPPKASRLPVQPPPEPRASAAATHPPHPPAASTTATNLPHPPSASTTATNVPHPHTASTTATNVPHPHMASTTATNVPRPHTASTTATNLPRPHTASTSTLSPFAGTQHLASASTQHLSGASIQHPPSGPTL